MPRIKKVEEVVADQVVTDSVTAAVGAEEIVTGGAVESAPIEEAPAEEMPVVVVLQGSSSPRVTRSRGSWNNPSKRKR